MNKNQTLAQFLGITQFPFELVFSEKNQKIKYVEKHDGFWEKSTFQFFDGKEKLMKKERSNGEILEFNKNGFPIYSKKENGDIDEYIFDQSGNVIRMQRFFVASGICRHYNHQGKNIYEKFPDGKFTKREYRDIPDLPNCSIEVYRETQDGVVFDNRQKKINLKEVAKQFGFAEPD